VEKRRVVISGIGAVSPFGWDFAALQSGLEKGECPVSALTEADMISGIDVRIGGKAPAFDAKSISREYRRTMSPMGVMAFVAAAEALRHAGINPATPLAEEYRDMGVCIASTTVSPGTLEAFFSTYVTLKNVESVRSTVFFKGMNHAVSSNIGAALGLAGRNISPAAACAGSLQAVGLSYEYIVFGKTDIMLAGGVDEFHPLLTATFDRIGAASHSREPATASRPFDRSRDGLVCSEGAGIFVLEEYTHAVARQARILAEVVGFATNASPSSLVFPDTHAIRHCMEEALTDARMDAADIDIVNAHATATESGDIAEGQAIGRVFGKKPLVNSLKGHMGHCMAASGTLELGAVIGAASRGFIHGTKNLDDIDERCGAINLVQAAAKSAARTILKNSFGLGGVNATLVVKIV
jgi:3-oxoacyl-[acyl-carrier-protein] synthase II